MSEGLKALEVIKNAPTFYVGCMSDVYTRNRWEVEVIEKELKEKEELEKDLKQVMSDYQDLGNRCEKELKALEIIKKVCNNFPITIREMIFKSELTQEEYDLLMEVLK